MKQFTSVLALFFCIIAQAKEAKATTLDQSAAMQDKLKAVRYSLRVEHGTFTGDGADVLKNAVAQARYLLIGEDHFTREIPLFTAAICRLAAPAGLAGMALEVSPDEAEFVASRLSQPGRWDQTIALTRKYPASIAFLESKQENDLIETCAQLSRDPSFDVWGLDQAFVGSANWLIDKMLASHPGPLAMAELERLKKVAAQNAALALTSGAYGPLFLLNPSSKQELQAAASAVSQDGGPEVQRIFHELQLSQAIYSEQANGDGNYKRAKLLKQNFEMAVQSLPPAARDQKIIVKFGDWHLYKGFNPLHHLDLGDYIAEYADGNNEESLHICVLGAKGIHRTIGKYGQPSATQNFTLVEDPMYSWMVPAIANQFLDSWTLYDLRKLRFQSLPGVDPNFARLIDGYDLLVIIPEITPADLTH